MRTPTRVLAALATAILGAATSLVGASTASAADVTPNSAIICDPYDSYANFTSYSTSYVTTHAKQVENWTGSSATRTISTDLVTSVTASVSYSTSVKVTAGVVIDGLEASSGLTLQASGAITNTSSESVTYTMANQGVYIFYAGTRKASGSWTGAVCSSTGQYWNTSYGTAKSWTINIEGGVWCGGRRPSSGLGYYVYGQYC